MTDTPTGRFETGRHPADPRAAAAPLSVPAGRPDHRDRRRRSLHRHQERHLQRAAVHRPFSRPADLAGRAADRGHGADRGRASASRRRSRSERPKLVYFMTIDKAKFRKPVVPGDVVEYHMTQDQAARRNMWWFRGEAKVGGELVARGRGRRHAGDRMSAMTADPSDAPSSRRRALGEDVRIGPFCIVGPEVELGDGCELISHVVVAGRTTHRPAHTHLSLRLHRPPAAGSEISPASPRR